MQEVLRGVLWPAVHREMWKKRPAGPNTYWVSKLGSLPDPCSHIPNSKFWCVQLPGLPQELCAAARGCGSDLSKGWEKEVFTLRCCLTYCCKGGNWWPNQARSKMYLRCICVSWSQIRNLGCAQKYPISGWDWSKASALASWKGCGAGNSTLVQISKHAILIKDRFSFRSKMCIFFKPWTSSKVM